jgi:hypothetical protein
VTAEGRARAKRTTAATKRVGGEWRTREREQRTRGTVDFGEAANSEKATSREIKSLVQGGYTDFMDSEESLWDFSCRPA